MKDEIYAHSREGKPREEWHWLEDHLIRVAEIARGFADEFQAGDWGYLAGLRPEPLFSEDVLIHGQGRPPRGGVD